MEQRKQHTDRILSCITEALIKSNLAKHQGLCVIVTGSYGRDEASEISDMDWFLVVDKTKNSLNEEEKSLILENVNTVIGEFVPKETGGTNTFASLIISSDLLENYGGDKETNQAFTRRMLYLLESKALYNNDMYNELKKSIVELYIKDSISDHNLSRFLLNDIIRYYRTICTDYEFKVCEQDKSWGVRKIKLRFSRKILYFSGLITVAKTCSLSREKKISETIKLLSLSPIARIKHVCGEHQSGAMLAYYSEFLTEISKADIRESINKISRENRNDNDEYRLLKNLSQHFNWELEKMFVSTFPLSHPIHGALLF